MADDGIREIHGGTPMAGKAKNPITLRERDTAIAVFQDYTERFELSPKSARFLARQLNRLSLRIERRTAQRIEAGTDETPRAAQPEGREPDPEGDAPK